ncbi:MAG: hypothetical protein U9O94_03260 [Nanoarchaeota archaeon]|nr:hypothetical protein [Nanoarchaeota archaeon]
MSNKIYVEDIGTVITIDTETTVTGAVNPTLRVKKPDGTIVSWDAAVEDQSLSIITEAGDLNLPGLYYIQAALTIDNWTGRGETAELTVYANFK